MAKELPRRSLTLLVSALTAAVLFILTALPAAAMTVTFVRHGESEANASHTIDNSIPGAHLTPRGQAQAAAVAAALVASGVNYDAVYTSNMVRTTETAAPFAAATGLTPTVLPGVREIGAGWFEGWSDSGPGGIGYVLAPALWTLGARSIPVPGGADGNAFDARMDAALQTIEDSGAQHPVVFSHAATIMFWTMMNVDNPDLGLMLRHRLDNTDTVVIEGSAEQGWTLTNWAGEPVGPASLGTKLFVDARNLVVAPQTAIATVARAFGTGDIGTIAAALRDGVGALLRAPVTFAVAVVRDIVDEVAKAIRPPAANTTVVNDTDSTVTLDVDTDTATAQSRIAAPTPAHATEPDMAAPAEKQRTERTARESRDRASASDRESNVAGLRGPREGSSNTPKRNARPDTAAADRDSADADKEAA